MNAYHLRVEYKAGIPENAAASFHREFIQRGNYGCGKCIAVAVERLPHTTNGTRNPVTFAIHLSFFTRAKKKTMQQYLYRLFVWKWRGRIVFTHHATQPDTPSAKVFLAAFEHEPVVKLCRGFTEEHIAELRKSASAPKLSGAVPSPAPYRPRNQKARAAFAKFDERLLRVENHIHRLERKLDRVLAMLIAAPEPQLKKATPHRRRDIRHSGEQIGSAASGDRDAQDSPSSGNASTRCPRRGK